jgi:excisionase family DNA binding protein
LDSFPKVNAVDDEKRSKKDEPVPAPKVLTVAEVAEYLRVHPTTIYRLLQAKKLPGFRVGSEWRFSKDTIDRWRGEEEEESDSRGRPRKNR